MAHHVNDVTLKPGNYTTSRDVTHFIGSLVVGETESKAIGPGRCNVIDGQQRLITLSVIIASIRDVLVSGQDDRTAISNNYLLFPDSGGLRLLLSDGDQQVYESIVEGNPLPDAKSLIASAYNFICRELREGLIAETESEDSAEDADATEDRSDESSYDAESPSDVDLDEIEETESPNNRADHWDWPTLLEVISHDLELVSISGVPAERSYQIFATLNYGGLKLTQVDLI